MKHPNMVAAFPRHIHTEPKPTQVTALTFLTKHGAGVIEAPTGSGKTDIGISFLTAFGDNGVQTRFYLAPNKTLVDQIKSMHPDVTVVYGRNEHPCLFYDGDFKADEVPCTMIDCRHRVSLETGKTQEPAVPPCPYYQQRYEAKQGGIVVATYAFYLYAHFFQGQQGLTEEAVVVDEVHRIAESIRSVLSFEITDLQIERAITALTPFAELEVINRLVEFKRAFHSTVTSKPAGAKAILTQDEVQELLYHILLLNPLKLRESVQKAVQSGRIDPVADREMLTRLEDVTNGLGRYLRALQYSVKTDDRRALNYAFAYWKTERSDNERVQYKLVVKAYSVSALIKKMLPERMLAMSATVSDPAILAIDSGISLPFLSLKSDWSHSNTRVFMPTDTPNLATNARGRDKVVRRNDPRNKSRVLRKVAQACKRFGDKGLRSLVVTVSNDEREKFLMLAAEEGVDVLSYDAERSARAVAQAFRAGEATVLVGTSANFGEGIDLPDGTAPVTFFLRPGYSSPTDPGTQFEKERFGSQAWALWNWRVVVQALQVRGRNVRSATDKGVTIFVSQQFRRFLVHSLPKWLQPAYRGELTFEQCLEETEALLLREKEETS